MNQKIRILLAGAFGCITCVLARIHLRRDYPSRISSIVQTLMPGTEFRYARVVENCEAVNRNARCYYDENDNYFGRARRAYFLRPRYRRGGWK